MTQWQRFEEAVATWVSALDSTAKITHDAKTPDRDTGELRQRDVWVETNALKVFPIRILISCKRCKCKLNQQHMDAFLGEIASSGAHKGVLYSFSGFTRPALAKAAAHGVTCATLYQDEPPRIPESLVMQFYCLASSFSLSVSRSALPSWGDFTFREVLEIRDPGGQSFLDRLARAFLEDQELEVDAATKARAFPRPWQSAVQLDLDDSELPPLWLQLNGKWRVYRAKLEANLLDGTYLFGEERFIGTLKGPFIDMKGPEPGPGWELVESLQEALEPGTVTYILEGGNTAQQLLEHYGDTRLRGLA